MRFQCLFHMLFSKNYKLINKLEMQALKSPLKFWFSFIRAFIFFPITCAKIVLGLIFMMIDSVASFIKSIFSSLFAKLLNFFPKNQIDTELKETNEERNEDESVIAFLLQEKKELEERLGKEKIIKKKMEQEINVRKRRSSDQNLMLGKEQKENIELLVQNGQLQKQLTESQQIVEQLRKENAKLRDKSLKTFVSESENFQELLEDTKSEKEGSQEQSEDFQNEQEIKIHQKMISIE